MNVSRFASLCLLIPALAVPALAASPAHAVSAKSAKATLKLSASTGLPGSSVTFHGTHFRKHEKVALHWSSAKGKVLKTVKASASGKISGKFAVPLPNGKVHLKTAVVAVGAKDHKKVKVSFKQQCTDAWASTKSGTWSTAKDWSTKAVPGSSDIACITYPRSKSYTVALTAATGSTTVDALVVGGRSGSHTQALELVGSGADMHLATTAGVVIEKHGVLDLGLGNPGGNTFLDGGRISNYGTIANTGNGFSRYYGAQVVNEPGASFDDTVACQNCDAYINANFINAGTINLGTGAAFVTGNIVFSQLAGAVHNSGSLILNHGSLLVETGTATGNPWLLRNGVAMSDLGAAAGAWEFQDGGTLTGNVATGQTIIVDGDAGSDVQLSLPATIANHGTIDLTSDNNYNNEGQTNSWLISGGSTKTELANYGLLETTGTGYSRYIEVDVTNEVGGQTVLGNPGAEGSDDNYLTVQQGYGNTTFTNDGTLTVGDNANLRLSGTTQGQADFVQSSTGTLNVTEDTTNGTNSLIHQLGCSGSGCQNEFIQLAGTLNVTTVGSAGGFFPILSDAYAVNGTFGQITGTPAYGAVYNVTDPSDLSAAGDVHVAPPV